MKPIQIAASKNNLAVVEVLFPLTTQVSDFPNWTVLCIMEYALRKNEEMVFITSFSSRFIKIFYNVNSWPTQIFKYGFQVTDQAHIEEADPWRSQFVKVCCNGMLCI